MYISFTTNILLSLIISVFIIEFIKGVIKYYDR